MAAGQITLAEPHRATVKAALATCFAGAPIDAIIPLAAGASASSILRIDAGRRRYLLRVEGPRSPLRYPDQYAALRIAADAGVAPRVHHVDEAAGIAITDFVEARPLDSYPGGPPALVRAVAELLRRLHDGPMVPAFMPYIDIVDHLFAHVRRTGLFTPGLLDGHVEHLEKLRESYDWDPAQAVSCHNDPLPSNILFDGRRLWLVDWESAYPNDPLVDIAIQLDNLAAAPGLEEMLVSAWLGRAPDGAIRKRLQYTRALSRLYYAGVLLSASATKPRAAPDDELDVIAGEPLTEHTRGKLYLKGFLKGGFVPPMP